MKRLRLDETVQEGGGGPAPPAANPAAGGGGLYRPSLPNAAAAIAYSGGPIKVVPGGGGDAMQYGPPAGYGAMPAAPAKPQQQPAQPPQRGKPASPPPPLPLAPPPQQQSPGSSSSSNFQRLKVEDALSYLDSVKYKFGDKPQVYNDFLDIMKEFKNQSIDTPGVIQRVSNLFNGFPDLIDGFNTFLPPGYKIDVQKSDRGYAFQVSVSVPRTAGGGALVSSEPVQKTSMILTGSGIIHGNVAAAPQAPPPPPPPPVLQQHVAAAYGNVAAALQQQQVAAVPQQQQPPQQHHLGLAAVQQQHHHHHHHHHQQQQQHNSALQFSAAQAAVNQALQGGHGEAPQNQPVEFNHAINYVNKIKNRFQGQPEKYKRFLEILHTYQKEQRTLKESSSQQQQQGPPPPAPGKHLTEQEVYSQVAKLFENQSDLLAEFGQFLPDATSHIGAAAPPPPAAAPDHHQQQPGAGAKKQGAAPPKPYGERPPAQPAAVAPQQQQKQQQAAAAAPLKRSPPYPNLLARDGPPPPKKHRLSTSCRDVTIAEAGKYCTLNDYAFFDKVRKAVRSQDVYNNFLRCLVIFNQEVVSRGELVQLVAPFLSRQPELLRWFRDFVGGQQPSDSASSASAPASSEPVPYAASQQRCAPDRPPDIDYSTAKRLGTSYCVIPPSQEGLRFSGRTQLCRDVLNNQWVSFPSWAEDNSFVGSRKNQYEEYMYRCEDERFELDVVIETNASAIRVLEGVAKRLARMAPDDAARYRLDDCLGGESPVLHQRALRRIYGEKAQDIVDGLKRSPAVAVPVVLRRLRAKEEEWREAQKGFNKVWRDQNEKYYLKSLDYQGINFKQNDVKALRSKNLFNEIETLFEERNEQNDEGAGKPIVGPHLVFHYRDRTILDDAANLLIHHVKRQTGIQKGEKRRIKHILRQFVPDLFFHPRQQPSDDERDEDDDEKEDGDESPRGGAPAAGGERRGSPAKSPAGPEAPRSSPDVKDEHQPLHAQTNDPDEAYTLFMASNNWYLFLRLHATLCERLARIYERAVALAAAEQRERGGRRESTAVALRLKPRPPIEAEDYYPAFLDMVKNLLDGNMEPSTYEDTLREMFGIHAYPAFTLDKVVSYAVRQLQHCVTERAAVAAADAFARERRRGAAGGACGTAHRRRRSEQAYERAAERHHHHDENCFRVYVYRRDCRLTIEMVDADGRGGGGEEVKPDGGGGKRWGRTERARRRLPLYLERNLRGYRGGGVGQARPVVAGRRLEPMEELEKKLNERLPAERGGGGGGGARPCGLDAVSMEVAYTADKGSVLYKYGAFARAKETHAAVTRRLAARFRAWLRRWLAAHVTDAQLDRCTEWLMGRGDDAVANRTRVEPCGDATRAPYAPYNRYRVERLPQQQQQRDPT